ncbi:MAG: PEPxxWA-CTERM sorting domain-containing protein [Phenylobacterium sp.]|nr:PEPxxWA-CTERM sorting domain-containing protein [Phenylobacterium sp.]MDP3854689.1 PEPxxWA-CTERM sorting domain-containing protein [Phenylobacterium sp.]
MTITFSSFQTALNPGEILVTDFDSPYTLAPGWSSVFAAAGLATGDNPLPDASAAPGFGTTVTDDDLTQYLAVYGTSTATFTGAASAVSMYVGSLDTGNQWTIYTTAGDFFFDGADLGVFSGVGSEYGERNAATTNGRFTFTSDAKITGFKLFSKSDSLEISDVGYSAVPEPATWAMMIIGFGAVGSMVRGARRRQAFAAA